MRDLKGRFIAIYNQYIKREGADRLLDWICSTDFFAAPASTKYHGSHEGGLVEHSLNVFDRLCRNLHNEWVSTHPESELFPMERLETIAIVSLLHDLCKAEFYALDYKNQKVYSEAGTKQDAKGKFEWESVPYYVVDEKLPFGHGEKSVYLISGYMALTVEEALSIRWHMGDFSVPATSRAYGMCPLAVQLHVADLQATYLDESRPEAQAAVESLDSNVIM